MNPYIGHLVLMLFLGGAFFAVVVTKPLATLIGKLPFSCIAENLQLLLCNIEQRKDY